MSSGSADSSYCSSPVVSWPDGVGMGRESCRQSRTLAFPSERTEGIDHVYANVGFAPDSPPYPSLVYDLGARAVAPRDSLNLALQEHCRTVSVKPGHAELVSRRPRSGRRVRLSCTAGVAPRPCVLPVPLSCRQAPAQAWPHHRSESLVLVHGVCTSVRRGTAGSWDASTYARADRSAPGLPPGRYRAGLPALRGRAPLAASPRASCRRTSYRLSRPGGERGRLLRTDSAAPDRDASIACSTFHARALLPMFNHRPSR